MAELWAVVGLSLMAGLAMPLGAAFASVERIGSDWLEQEFRHSVIAFGAGALLSAVALVLVPEGRAHLSVLPAVGCFAAGGIVFMLLDRWLASMKNSVAQLVAMLADFIPEALALGAALAAGSSAGVLLALLMAMQNVPEGFNAYRELTVLSDHQGERVIAAFVLMALLGPIAGVAGYFWLAGYPAAMAGIMLFASGGILYLVFQDIAPQVRLECHWAPPLGAVAGFMLGLIGEMLIA